VSRNRRTILIGAQDFGPYWIGLAAKAGLTTLGLHPVSNVPAEDPRSLESLLARLKDPSFLGDVGELKSRGVELSLEAHAMHRLLPRDRFGSHPEWFRMEEGGVRTPDLNLCPSSEEALEVVEAQAEEMVERIAEVFDGHRYHLWMDDNSRYCRCDRCRGLSASDQALTVCNRVAQGVRRADPEGKTAYLAYQGTLAAPEKVKPLPGIFVEYAPVDRDSRFPLASGRSEKNATARSFIPALLDAFGREGSQALEYWLDDTYFYRWTPPYGELPFYRGVVRRDARYYRSLGFENIATFACGINAEYEEEFGPPPVEEFGRILAEEF
jgi:hypothetical protein